MWSNSGRYIQWLTCQSLLHWARAYTRKQTVGRFKLSFTLAWTVCFPRNIFSGWNACYATHAYGQITNLAQWRNSAINTPLPIDALLHSVIHQRAGCSLAPNLLSTAGGCRCCLQKFGDASAKHGTPRRLTAGLSPDCLVTQQLPHFFPVSHKNVLLLTTFVLIVMLLNVNRSLKYF